MSSIARRAKVCPQCRLSVTFLSSVQEFFKTTAWLATSLVALWYASIEKVEKLGLKEDLDAVQANVTVKAKELLVANITNDILKQRVENLFGARTYGSFEGLDGSAEPSIEESAVSFEDQISEIETEIEKVLDSPNPDQQRLRDLLDEKVSLELQR